MANTPAPKSGGRKSVARDVEKFEEDMRPMPADPSSPRLAGKLAGEFVGTFVLMLLGLGVALGTIWSQSPVGWLIVGLAFGFAVIGLIVALGHVSGAHFNPAVTIGLWAAGRFPGRDVLLYIPVQVLGALSAVAVLVLTIHTHPDIDSGLAGAAKSTDMIAQLRIGWGDLSPLGFGLPAAIIIEILATGLLVAVVLSATSVRAPKGQAPVSIGLALAILVIFAVPFTNASLNPARATATWFLATDRPFDQIWPWWVTGIVAGALVGFLYRAFGPLEDIKVGPDANREDA